MREKTDEAYALKSAVLSQAYTIRQKHMNEEISNLRVRR